MKQQEWAGGDVGYSQPSGRSRPTSGWTKFMCIQPKTQTYLIRNYYQEPSTNTSEGGVENYIWYCSTSGTAVLSLSTAAIIAIGTVLGDQYIIRKSVTCWFTQAIKRQKWYYSREKRFGPRLARHRASLGPNLFSLE